MFRSALLKVGDRIKNIERLVDPDESLSVRSEAVPTEDGSTASLWLRDIWWGALGARRNYMLDFEPLRDLEWIRSREQSNEMTRHDRGTTPESTIGDSTFASSGARAWVGRTKTQKTYWMSQNEVFRRWSTDHRRHASQEDIDPAANESAKRWTSQTHHSDVSWETPYTPPRNEGQLGDFLVCQGTLNVTRFQSQDYRQSHPRKDGVGSASTCVMCHETCQFVRIRHLACTLGWIN